MAVNFIAIFCFYTTFFKSIVMTNNEFYNFLIDVAFISLFSYVGTIITIIFLIMLIYIIYINNANLNSFSFFNKLEAVAITIEYIEGFKNIREFQIKFNQILLANFK